MITLHHLPISSDRHKTTRLIVWIKNGAQQVVITLPLQHPPLHRVIAPCTALIDHVMGNSAKIAYSCVRIRKAALFPLPEQLTKEAPFPSLQLCTSTGVAPAIT